MALGRDDMDALLVAYLDGELDPPRRQELEQRLRDDAALKARLAALAEAGRPLRGAFDTLLDVAPRGRLETAFAAASAKAQTRPQFRYRRMLVAAAASLLLLLCGGVAGYLVAKAPAELFEEADELEEAWVGAVAGQLSLYNAASLAAIDVPSAELEAQLAKLGEMLGLDLSKERVTFEGSRSSAPNCCTSRTAPLPSFSMRARTTGRLRSASWRLRAARERARSKAATD